MRGSEAPRGFPKSFRCVRIARVWFAEVTLYIWPLKLEMFSLLKRLKNSAMNCSRYLSVK